MRNGTILLVAAVSVLISGCANPPKQPTQLPGDKLPIAQYRCKHTVDEIKIDGVLDEQSWKQADRVPIQVEWTTWRLLEQPAGYGWMCWDDKNFYIAMEMPDTNICAAGEERDKGNIIEPNDVIEVFLDVNGDDEHFFELHVNPLNTFNDLFIIRPREGSPLWDRSRFKIMFMPEYNLPEYKTAVKVYGVLNQAEPKDEKWAMEMALPYTALMMPFPKGKDAPKPHPDVGDVWRIQLVVQNCDLPKRYYVWSPSYSNWHHHGIQRYGKVEFAK